MEISIPQDCGNAPRKQFIADFNIAFAKGDVQFLSTCFADDAVWNLIGDKQLSGKENIMKALTEMAGYVAQSIEVKTIITHGKTAAAEGSLSFGEGNVIAYCDTYEFVSAGNNLIKTLNSYIVELKPTKS